MRGTETFRYEIKNILVIYSKKMKNHKEGDTSNQNNEEHIARKTHMLQLLCDSGMDNLECAF